MGSVSEESDSFSSRRFHAVLDRNLTHKIEDGSDAVDIIVHVNLLYSFKTDCVVLVSEENPLRERAENNIVHAQRHLRRKRKEAAVVFRGEDVLFLTCLTRPSRKLRDTQNPHGDSPVAIRRPLCYNHNGHET